MYYVLNRSTGNLAAEYTDKDMALKEAGRQTAVTGQPHAVLDVDDQPMPEHQFQTLRRVVGSYGYGPTLTNVPAMQPPLFFQPLNDSDNDATELEDD